MTQHTLIAVDPEVLDLIRSIRYDLTRLNQRIDAVQMAPKPDWVTVKEYSELVGKSPDTVKR